MTKVLIAYATREGQTLKVAGHVASTLGGLGRAIECVNVSDVRTPLDWPAYAGCILAASVHQGGHEREMVRFVASHAAELSRIRTGFLSVGMHEATVENPSSPRARRQEARREVELQIEEFFNQTGFRADRVQPVAGALAYRRYGWAMRQVLRLIARRMGLSTDTSHDREYTNWQEIERFATDFHSRLGDAPGIAGAQPAPISG